MAWVILSNFRKDPNIVASKIYFPDDPPIQIHQSRVQLCPTSFPTNFYWYENKRAKPSRPSKKVMKHLSDLQTEMKHLCKVNRTDNAKPDNAEADNAEDELSKQTNQTPPHIDKCPYFL